MVLCQLFLEVYRFLECVWSNQNWRLFWNIWENWNKKILRKSNNRPTSVFFKSWEPCAFLFYKTNWELKKTRNPITCWQTMRTYKYEDFKRRKIEICPNPQKNLGDLITFFLKMWWFFWNLKKCSLDHVAWDYSYSKMAKFHHTKKMAVPNTSFNFYDEYN